MTDKTDDSDPGRDDTRRSAADHLRDFADWADRHLGRAARYLDLARLLTVFVRDLANWAAGSGGPSPA
ncbi:hypothetical protein [Kitasatospora sp. NPDC059327]|uniref:hypothetical protein n=1 Tax=Kitasatospora sp. NPDC059327 TaxID=3346803 RepID=UPI00367817B1